MKNIRNIEENFIWIQQTQQQASNEEMEVIKIY